MAMIDEKNMHAVPLLLYTIKIFVIEGKIWVIEGVAFGDHPTPDIEQQPPVEMIVERTTCGAFMMDQNRMRHVQIPFSSGKQAQAQVHILIVCAVMLLKPAFLQKIITLDHQARPGHRGDLT